MSETLSYVFKDKRGSVLYSASPHRAMIPASNMKIVTGFVSSVILGDDFEIKTYFRVSESDLIITGGPTPLLRIEEIERIIERLKDYKIKRVMFNRSLDEDYYAPGWPSEDQRECYQSRITSFSLNENCIPRSETDNGKNWVEPHSGRKITDIRPYDTLSRTLVSEGERDIFPSFDFTDSNDGKLVYTHKEKVGDILEHLEPISCNFSADVLFKFVHHYKASLLGSWRGGSSVTRKSLERMNLLEPNLTIVDGSGLSSFNRLTPSFISDLLRKALSVENGKFIEHMASPGDGTLRKRLDEFGDYGIKAKTGSLTGVATISGFIRKLNVTFSLMLNNTEKKGKDARDVLDETLTEMIHKIEKNRKSGRGN